MIDWHAIYSEYIGGGISQRKLAEKHGVSVDALLSRAHKEHWAKDREKAANKATMRAQQKVADAVTDNAKIAEDIKKRLLMRIKRIEEKFPEDATEVRTIQGKTTVIYRLRDLTAALKELTDDLPKQGTDKNAPIYDLLKRLNDECDV